MHLLIISDRDLFALAMVGLHHLKPMKCFMFPKKLPCCVRRKVEYENLVSNKLIQVKVQPYEYGLHKRETPGLVYSTKLTPVGGG